MKKIIFLKIILFSILLSCSDENSDSNKNLLKRNGFDSKELIGKSFTLYNILSNNNINISFYDTNNHISGFAGANIYNGFYSNINGEVRFFDIITTKMSAPQDIMDGENQFLQYLESAKYMTLMRNELIIITSDYEMLKFEENIINTEDLKDKKFRLSNTLELFDEFEEFEEIEITISIENNYFIGNSGINNYNIPFEINNNKITIGENGISTLMSGPEEDMKIEDKYMELLNSAQYISYDNYNLCIKTADNRLLLFNIID